MKDQEHCRGCVDDFYNQGGNGMGGNGCWHLKTAKLVTRYRIGTWTEPTQRGAFSEARVLNCRHENGEHFYDKLPDFVKREDVIWLKPAKAAVALLALLLVAGCSDSVPTRPTSQPVPTVAPTVPPVRLVVPVIVWGLDRTGEHPGVTLRPSVAVSAIEVANAKSEVVARPRAGVHVELPAWGWYSVRGQVNGIFSDWFQFELVPNPCGDCQRTPQPPPPPVPVCKNVAADGVTCEDGRDRR